MVSKKKGPINITLNTRDRFNKFRDYHNIKNEKKVTQDGFIQKLLDLYKEKHDEIKIIIKGE